MAFHPLFVFGGLRGRDFSMWLQTDRRKVENNASVLGSEMAQALLNHIPSWIAYFTRYLDFPSKFHL